MSAAQALKTYAKRRAEIEAGAVKPARTYSVVRDGNDGYGVRCDQTHHFVNEEPIATEAKANRFLEILRRVSGEH